MLDAIQSLGHPNEDFQTGSKKFTNLQEQKAKTWSLALGFPFKQNQLIKAKKLFLMSLLEDKVWAYGPQVCFVVSISLSTKL